MGKYINFKHAFLILSGVLSLNAFAFEEDPFIPMLPKETVKKQVETPVTVKPEIIEEVVAPPPLVIAGVLWGTDKPMAIINDKIYGVGAVIGESGAKVHEIKNNVVTVIYKMQKFDLTVTKKITKEEK